MKILPILGLGLVVLFGCRVREIQPHKAAASMIGHPFPGFAFPSIQGRDSVRSQDLAGSTSLVVFWATWCEPCRREVEVLKRLHGSDSSLKIIGLSVDESPAAVPLLVNRLSMSYPVGIGALSLFSQLGLDEIPQGFVLDSKGMVRDTFGSSEEDQLLAAIRKARLPE
jgi:cytochrome c biogenesis protein CcmG, thiol:disulfide interchange protein DsbE